MPRKRQSGELWRQTRRRIHQRDKGRCQGPYCADKPPWSLPLHKAHVDHIRSGKLGSNADDNLRLLCRRCHVLRLDGRHRGMISKALADGLIPPDWRRYLWEDGDPTPKTWP
jgi:5-methylcytosine-specific restriction enzyme A